MDRSGERGSDETEKPNARELLRRPAPGSRTGSVRVQIPHLREVCGGETERPLVLDVRTIGVLAHYAEAIGAVARAAAPGPPRAKHRSKALPEGDVAQFDGIDLRGILSPA